MTPNQSDLTKNHSGRKSLNQFSEALDVKHKTDVQRFGASKWKLKAIKTGNTLWSNISKRRGHSKINQKVKGALYNWILNNSHVVQSPIANNFPYVYIDSNSKTLMPKMLLQFSVRELYNITVIPPKKCGLKEERDTKNSIIIIDSNLHNILPP